MGFIELRLSLKSDLGQCIWVVRVVSLKLDLDNAIGLLGFI